MKHPLRIFLIGLIGLSLSSFTTHPAYAQKVPPSVEEEDTDIAAALAEAGAEEEVPVEEEATAEEAATEEAVTEEEVPVEEEAATEEAVTEEEVPVEEEAATEEAVTEEEVPVEEKAATEEEAPAEEEAAIEEAATEEEAPAEEDAAIEEGSEEEAPAEEDAAIEEGSEEEAPAEEDAAIEEAATEEAATEEEATGEEETPAEEEAAEEEKPKKKKKKVELPKRQLTLTDDEASPPEVSPPADKALAEQKNIIKQTNKLDKTNQSLEGEIRKLVAKFQNGYQAVDTKVDASSTKIHTSLGMLYITAKRIQEYLTKLQLKSPEATKLKTTFNDFQEKINELKTSIAKIGTQKQALLQQKQLAEALGSEASATANKSGKARQNILSGKDPAKNKDLLLKLSGELTETEENLTSQHKLFASVKKEILKQIKQLSSQAKGLTSQATTMHEQVKKIGEEKEKASALKEKALAPALKQMIEEVKEIQVEEELVSLRWYEFVPASLFRLIAKGRDAVKGWFQKEEEEIEAIAKDDTSPTGTIVRKLNRKISRLKKQKKAARILEKKYKELEEEKKKMLKGTGFRDFKPPKPKNIGDRVKDVVWSVFALGRDGFLYIGSKTNDLINKIARIKVKKIKQAAPPEEIEEDSAEETGEETEKVPPSTKEGEKAPAKAKETMGLPSMQTPSTQEIMAQAMAEAQATLPIGKKDIGKQALAAALGKDVPIAEEGTVDEVAARMLKKAEEAVGPLEPEEAAAEGEAEEAPEEAPEEEEATAEEEAALEEEEAALEEEEAPAEE